MRIEKFWAFFVVASSVSVLSAFQNCSDVKVSDRPSIAPPSPPVYPLAKPFGELCAPKGVVFGAPVRIVIILDMSASNIGTIDAWTDTNNMTHWSIDKDDGPTDLTGQRFDQIKNFIQNCGSSINVKYSIIGFSRRAQFARGQSCLSAFESQEEAVKTVDVFKAQQVADLGHTYATGPYPYNLGNETNYTAATVCLGQKIQEDLTLLSDERPVYHAFFLTDGQPTDNDPDLINTLKGQIGNINLATMNSASGFHFQGIYYTSPGAKNGGAQQAAALNNLTSMTQVTEGPTGIALNIQDLATTQQQLCSKIQPNSQVDYNLKSLYAVNLSTLMRKNVIEADSDMDGVTDKEEQALGWTIDDSHSTGPLDGICYWSSRDKSTCQSVASGLTCAAGGFNLGLSQCDRAYGNKLFGRGLNNSDIDRDSVPNFIEIIRGTALSRADMLDNPTADGINNFLKITQGMDVAASTATWPIGSEYLMDIKYEVSEQLCSTGLKKVDYELDQIPFVDVVKYTDPSDDVSVNLSHEANENVVLVFSVWQSSGGITLPNRLYMQKWIVPKAADPKKEEVKFLGEF